jgi:hypothetical protein
MPSYRELPAVRVTNGWRVYFVYDAEGVLRGRAGAFHEEGARREVATLNGLNYEFLKAETRAREPQ